jgi:glycerol-3-phosphate acyltransferase PlsX
LNILVDAMGGDNAPFAIVKGCVEAVNEQIGFDITLIGDEKEIIKALEGENFDRKRIRIKATTEVITNHDKPTEAIRNKKDSSMVVGFRMLKEKLGDAFLSAGNTGALLTASLLLLGRMKGVLRPALGAIIPTRGMETLLIDAGLNSAVRPESYVQFAHFGAEYMKALYGEKNPTVGLVNIGSEDSKGTAEVKEANELLRKAHLNFVGNLEGNDIINGKAKVVVCDGFVGNVLLKFFEGTGMYILESLKGILKKNTFNKLAGAVLKKDLSEFFRPMNADIVGGAPILGVQGLVMKSHGSSRALTIKNVIAKTVKLVNADITGHIKMSLEGEF